MVGFLIPFTQKVAIRRSLLQWMCRDLERIRIKTNGMNAVWHSPGIHVVNQNQRYEARVGFTGV